MAKVHAKEKNEAKFERLCFSKKLTRVETKVTYHALKDVSFLLHRLDCWFDGRHIPRNPAV